MIELYLALGLFALLILAWIALPSTIEAELVTEQPAWTGAEGMATAQGGAQ